MTSNLNIGMYTNVNSPWDWRQIVIKMGIKHFIYQKLANSW